MNQYLRHFQMTSSKSGASDLSIVLLSLIIVAFEEPYLSRNLSNAILIGIMVLFLVIEINGLLAISSNKRSVLGAIAVYTLFMATYKLIGISTAEFYYYFNTIQFLFICVAMLFILGRTTPVQKKILIFVIIASTLIAMFSNILLYVKYGMAYAGLYRLNRYANNAYSTQNVSSLVWFFGILYTLFLHEKKKSYKVFLLFCIAITGYVLIFVTQRMTTLVLLVTMIPLLNLVQKKDQMHFLLMVVMFVMVIAFYRYYSSILKWLGNQIGSQRLSRRINQIIALMDTKNVESAGGSLSARYELIMVSVHSFLKSISSILFGVGDHRNTNLIIGNHSQFFDDLARYGLFCGFVVYTMLLNAYRVLQDFINLQKDNPLYRQLQIIYVFFIIRGFLGATFEITNGIQIFLLLPLTFELIHEKEMENDGFSL